MGRPGVLFFVVMLMGKSLVVRYGRRSCMRRFRAS